MPVATVNGVNLSYQVKGKGPPLVLIHGFACSRRVWDPVLDRLARERQVFAYDHRGHGDSDKPEGPYQIRTFVEDLVGFLNFVGLDRVELAGHSMGGRTALMFSIEHGERLERLMLVGASGAAPQGDPRKRFEVLKEVASNQGMEAVFNHDLARAMLPQNLLEGEAAEDFHTQYLKNSPTGFCASADAILSMPDLTGRLGEIQTQTWICVGEQDAGPLAFSELCLERIPDSARAVIPGCGHYPMQETPETFGNELTAFWQSTSSDG